MKTFKKYINEIANSDYPSGEVLFPRNYTIKGDDPIAKMHSHLSDYYHHLQNGNHEDADISLSRFGFYHMKHALDTSQKIIDLANDPSVTIQEKVKTMFPHAVSLGKLNDVATGVFNSRGRGHAVPYEILQGEHLTQAVPITFKRLQQNMLQIQKAYVDPHSFHNYVTSRFAEQENPPTDHEMFEESYADAINHRDTAQAFFDHIEDENLPRPDREHE